MFSPTLHSAGVGRRRRRRDGALAGDRPRGTRRAWPLLFSASSYPLGAQSESDVNGILAYRGGVGCRRPPGFWQWMDCCWR